MAVVCRNLDCDYTKRHGPIIDGLTRFCPDCGTTLEDGDAETIAALKSAQCVGPGIRFGGFLIDWLIVLVFNLVAAIPGIGVLPVFIAALFWLFRDVNGASPGKTLVGAKVLSRGGGPSTAQQRILRNLPFAIMILPLAIPFLGWLDYGIQGVVFLIEAILVLLTGYRLGDRIAGTVVAARDGVAVQPPI